MLAMARMFDTVRASGGGVGRRRSCASSVVSCRKISSRLRRDGRSSTRPQSLDTTRRATSRRRSSPLWQSISKLASVPRWSTGVTRDTPGTPPSAAATSTPAGASTCTKIVWLPWMRSVSASGRVDRDDLALVDDHHALAGLRDLGQDVRAQDDGVRARQPLDEVAGLHDLLRVEAGGRLVEDQDLGVVQDRLRQPDALPVALRELAAERVATSATRAFSIAVSTCARSALDATPRIRPTNSR